MTEEPKILESISILEKEREKLKTEIKNLPDTVKKMKREELESFYCRERGYSLDCVAQSYLVTIEAWKRDLGKEKQKQPTK